MSRHETVEITCSQCGGTGQYELWSTVNSTLSPEATEALMDGSLFVYECRHCGAKTHVISACLFNDMEHHVMLQFVANDRAAAEAKELYASLSEGDLYEAAKEAGYRYRVVTELNDLREKAKIFCNGFDDRAIELMKVLLVDLHGEELELPEGAKTYYDGLNEDGSLIFVFVKEEWLNAAFAPRGFYEVVENGLYENESKDEGLRTIDAEWARLFLGR